MKSPRPVEGSQPRITANTMISISPTQKVGSEKPRIDPAMMARLAGDSGLRPAYMPSGMPNTTARMKAAKANSSVAGMRCRISLSAGSPKMNELPRSPRAALARKWKYCSCTGRSRPRRWMKRSISSCVMSSEIRMCTGSPTRCTPTNTTSDITRTTTRLWRTLLMMKTILFRFADPRRQRVLVGARLIGEAAAHRPGVHLVVQRNDADVIDRHLGSAREQLGALRVVRRGERLVQEFVHLGIGVAAAVRCPHALLAVEGREQRLERRRSLAGPRSPAHQDEAELGSLVGRPG